MSLNALARGRGVPFMPPPGGNQRAGGTRVWDPNAWMNDPNRFGRAGEIMGSRDAWEGTDPNAHRYNPDYIDMHTSQEENGNYYSWRLKPAVAQRLGNRVQVQNPDNIADQGQIQWDDEFGWVTDKNNVKERGGVTGWLRDGGLMALVSAGLLGPAAAHAGLFGGMPPGAESAGVPGATGATGGLGSLSELLKGGGGLLKALGSGGLKLLSSLLNGGGNGPGGRGPGGGGGLNDLLRLALTGGAAYAGNKQNKNYESDINRMIELGTAGVTNDDRAGARNLVTGIYDGSISGDEVFNRVPGLRALSERGAADIARKWSSRGEAAPNDPHAMREWIGYNNELTSKAWDSEMNRAAQIGGFNFNPAAAAGFGMDAFSKLDFNQRMNTNNIFDSLGRFLNGGNGSDGGDFWDMISGLFGGNGDDGFLGEVGDIGQWFDDLDGYVPDDYGYVDDWGGDW